MQTLRTVAKWITPWVVALSLFNITGCKKGSRLIEKVTFKPSQNLEVIRVSLVFGSKIKSDFAGSFSIKDYGYLFLNPYTTTQPFEIGFDLNTSIVNEQDYIDITPTTVLPNGLPIGIPQAVVEIKSPTPIHPKFDIFGYVDILSKSWLGLAAMFSQIDEYFPMGLSVSQSFLSNAQGAPGVFASVFGPTVGSDGSIVRSGGIAVFANVRQLIEDMKAGRIKPTPEGEFVFEPSDEEIQLNGPAAPYYEEHPEALEGLYRRLLKSMNAEN
jgi:hypothetical protein